MTRRVDPAPWGDDRLRTAFAALSDSQPTPTEMTDRVCAVIRADTQTRPAVGWHRFAPVVTTATIVVVGVIGLAILGPLGNGFGPREATDAPPSAGPSTARSIADLPVLSIGELLDRESAPGPEEVIVHAWAGRAPATADCDVSATRHPLVPDCQEWYLFLMDSAEDLNGRAAPAGPSLVPMLRVDAHVAVDVPFGPPVEVIAIGHQSDHRASTCPPADGAACRARFVIDRLVAPGTDLARQPTPWASDATPQREPERVLASLRGAVGDIALVSIGVIAEDRLARIEPIVSGNQADSFGMWVVRALVRAGPDPGVARTFLLPDSRRLANVDGSVSEVTGTGVVALAPLPPVSPTPIPLATLPSNIMGIPIIGVGDAIAVRDDDVNDRELAVRGWFSPISPMSCPYTLATSPVQPVCPDDWTVLMEEPESLVTVAPDGFEGRTPTSPSFQIDFDDLDRTWEPELPVVGPATPIELVVVGHFDDRRSFACPLADVDRCRDRFVVDRVAFADGRAMPTSALDLVDGGAVSAAAEVEATVSETARGAEFLSMAAVDGELGLQRVEPSIGVFAPLQGQRAVWVVRLLDRCVIRCTARGVGEFGTYLVVDGTDALFKIDADNVATQVAGSLSLASPDPWPPDGATVVVMGSPVGAGRPPARVAVVDRSGWLASVREVRPDDPGLIDTLGGNAVAFFDDPAHGGRFRLAWIGGVCDGDMTVTIEARIERIIVDGGLQPPCDAMGVLRELVLDFSGPVDPGIVEVRYIETRIID